MSNLLTVVRYLVPVFATIGLLCVASWAAVATLVWRETRNRQHDAEDTAVNHGLPLPSPDASDADFEAWVRQALRIAAPDGTPIYTQIAAEKLRAELEDESAVERWLSA